MIAKVIIIAIIVTLTVLSGLISNNIVIPDFPRRNHLFIRLIVWITLLSLIAEIVFLESIDQHFKHICIAIGFMLFGITLMDMFNLYSAWKRKIHSPEKQITVDWKKQLLTTTKHIVSRRIEDNLNLGTINLVFDRDFEKIGRPNKSGRVLLEESNFLLSGNEDSKIQIIGSRFLKLFKKDSSLLLYPQESLISIFDKVEIGGRLLILGEPGTGKTTSILKLTESLLERSEETGEIPYIFELSTWKKEHRTIEKWISEQLYIAHQVPAEITRKWIENCILLSLFDGLDELGPRQGQAMIQLNEFIHKRLNQKAVICCRYKEYNQALKVDPDLRILNSMSGALCLNLLSNGQIKKYLESIGKGHVWKNLANNKQNSQFIKDDRHFLRIPLFLKIFSSFELQEKDIRDKRALIKLYTSESLSFQTRQNSRSEAANNSLALRYCFAYKKIDREPSVRDTELYLNWLAKIMVKNSYVDFLVEKIQPKWIEHSPWFILYVFLTVLLTISSIFSLSFFLLLMYPLVGFLQAINGATGLTFLVSLFLLPTYFNGVLPMNRSIKTLEAVSFRKIKERFKLSFFIFKFLFIGIISPFFVGYFLVSQVKMPSVYLLWSFLYILSTYLCLEVFFLSSTEVNYKEKPNQGMIITLGNGFLLTLFIGLLGIVMTIVFAVLFDQKLTIKGVFWLLHLSVLISFVSVGIFVIQHVALRLTLAISKKTPWNYVRFLNYCVERRLLQRIGGKYRFLHRELLDYFSEIDTQH